MFNIIYFWAIMIVVLVIVVQATNESSARPVLVRCFESSRGPLCCCISYRSFEFVHMRPRGRFEIWGEFVGQWCSPTLWNPTIEASFREVAHRHVAMSSLDRNAEGLSLGVIPSVKKRMGGWSFFGG